ncbi:ATP-binding cassette domain-containing protein [Bosea vestrisii]|uniref:ATP-binding cassette domain-containing protein n=1 Tax=Bosea vestrisii TaxID=151416 RepID=UPI0024E036ED|nr:ATP-binding cassette domain-containing protein [Bosea vestrisii]WID94206.1 ATP-binding cassette domain-containing protein [Bosea vestrisii]
MAAILEADDLSFSVRSSALVRGASLSLEEGTTTIVVGPNGAGKSTLLKLLTGELSPLQGTVRMDGAALPQIPAWELACRRAVMVQNQRLAFPFSVYEVARLGLEGVGRAQPRARKGEIIAQALETAGVIGLAGRQYQTLSGGEQQRVQFARALCQLEAGRSVAQRQIPLPRRADRQPRPLSPALAARRSPHHRRAGRGRAGGAARPQSRRDLCRPAGGDA